MQVVIKRICVPTDFSEPAERALHCGAALAEKFGAELYLLHVLQDVRALVSHPDFTAHGDAARAYFNRLEQEEAGRVIPAEDPSAQFLKTLEQTAHDEFQKLPLQAWWERLPIKKLLRYGNPVEEICHFARKKPIDMLVMGTHGRTGLKHMLLGSVVERVVRISPCPVLTVRFPEHDFLVEDE